MNINNTSGIQHLKNNDTYRVVCIFWMVCSHPPWTHGQVVVDSTDLGLPPCRARFCRS